MTRRRKLILAFSVLLIVLFMGGTLVFLYRATLAEKARNYLIAHIDLVTGGKTTIGSLQLKFVPFQIIIRDFQLRGTEPASEPPLVAIKEARVRPRLSVHFEGNRLRVVELDQPVVRIRIDSNGLSNLPRPTFPLKELDLFNLGIDRLRIFGGALSLEQKRFNLDAEFSSFRLLLRHEFFRQAYQVALAYDKGSWRYGSWEGQHQLGLSAVLLKDELRIDKLVFTFNQSTLEAQGALKHLGLPEGQLDFTGVMALNLVRQFYPETRNLQGSIGVSGRLEIGRNGWSASGQLEGRELSFDTVKIDKATGRFLMKPDQFRFDEIRVAGLRGSAEGSLRVDSPFHQPSFRSEFTFSHISFSELALVARLESKIRFASFLDGALAANWEGEWKNFTGNGQLKISKDKEGGQPGLAGPKPVPLEGRLNFVVARWSSSFQDSFLQLENTRLLISGVLSPTTTSNLHVELHCPDLTQPAVYFPEFNDVQGSAEFSGFITGTFKDPEFRGKITADKLVARKVSLDRLEGQLRAKPNEVELLHLSAVQNGARIEASGRIYLNPQWLQPVGAENLQLKVQNAPLQNLIAFAGRSLPIKGNASGEISVDGFYPDLTLRGNGRIQKGEIYDQPFDTLELEMQGRPTWFAVSRFRVELGKGHLDGSAELDLKEQFVQANLKGTEIELAQLQWLPTQTYRLRGRLAALELKTAGPIQGPKIDGSARVKGLNVMGEEVGDFATEFHNHDKDVEFKAESTTPSLPLWAKGEFRLSAELPLHAEVQFQNLSFTPYLKKLLPAAPETFTSQGSGSFSISGPLRSPEKLSLSGSLSALKLAFHETELQASRSFGVSYRDQKLSINNAAFTGRGTALKLNGTVDLSRNMRLELNLTGDLDLALVSEFSRKIVVKGNGTVSADIRGTLADPQIKGSAEVRAEQCAYQGFPNSLSQVSGRFFFDEHQVNIESLTGVSGGGQVKFTGMLGFGQSQLNSISLKIEAREVRVRYPEGMRNVLNADLTLRGSQRSQSLAGTIQIQNASFQKDYDPIAEFLKNKNPAVSFPAARDLGEHMNLDLLISADRNIRLETNFVKVDTGANLQVKGTVANPSITGSLEASGGDLFFQGTRYRITRGRIDFLNPIRLEPVIDVEAEADVRDYRVILTLKGTSDKLHADLRSDPPLATVDLFSLISPGGSGAQLSPGSMFRPYSSTGRQMDTPAGAGSLLSEGLSMKMGSSVKRIFGLDQFLIEPRSFLYNGRRDPSAQVTVGQQITRNFSATYSTSVSNNEQQVIILIYNVNDSTSIIASRDADGYFGLDVRFRKRLGQKH